MSINLNNSFFLLVLPLHGLLACPCYGPYLLVFGLARGMGLVSFYFFRSFLVVFVPGLWVRLVLPELSSSHS